MRVTILGSGGWIPVRGETSCVLVENGDDLIILDAGTGVANLYAHREVLSRYDTVHLILSHYHLDHTIGLIYLDPLVRGKRLRVYGPGLMAYEASNQELLDALLRREFFSRGIDAFSDDVACLDFPDEEFLVGSTRVRVQRQQHTAPSFRITLDDRLVYATDTTCPAEAWEGSSGSLLIHECWELDGKDDPRHTTLWQIEHNVPCKSFANVALVHHNPAWSEEDLERARRHLVGTNIQFAHDHMVFEL